MRIDLGALVHRKAGRCPIAGPAGGGIDDPLNARSPAGFTNIDCPQHVAASVELRIGHRSPKINLRGKMENDVGVGARDDIGQLRRLNIETHEGKPARVKRVVAKRMLEVGHNARTNVIDSKHLVAFGQEAVDECGPDEPGGPGNEGSHSGVSCPTKASRCLSVTTDPGKFLSGVMWMGEKRGAGRCSIAGPRTRHGRCAVHGDAHRVTPLVE